MSKRSPDWVKESEAAEKLGYKPATLRRYVKRGSLNIAYTTLRGRRFQYNMTDIDRLLLENSTFIK
jgi:predicted site-specific integrase-resolvase